MYITIKMSETHRDKEKAVVTTAESRQQRVHLSTAKLPPHTHSCHHSPDSIFLGSFNPGVRAFKEHVLVTLHRRYEGITRIKTEGMSLLAGLGMPRNPPRRAGQRPERENSGLPCLGCCHHDVILGGWADRYIVVFIICVIVCNIEGSYSLSVYM